MYLTWRLSIGDIGFDFQIRVFGLQLGVLFGCHHFFDEFNHFLKCLGLQVAFEEDFFIKFEVEILSELRENLFLLKFTVQAASSNLGLENGMLVVLEVRNAEVRVSIYVLEIAAEPASGLLTYFVPSAVEVVERSDGSFLL